MNISIKSKERVEKFGEVFTPNKIVHKMNDLVPEEKWKDPDTLFFEPTCGNGQFIEAIFLKRMKMLEIDDFLQKTKTALNTLWGMDIQQDNIDDCHRRLYKSIIFLGGTDIIFSTKDVSEFITIVEHNIFVVTNTLDWVKPDKNDVTEFEKIGFIFDVSCSSINQAQKTLMNRTQQVLRLKTEKGPIEEFYSLF